MFLRESLWYESTASKYGNGFLQLQLWRFHNRFRISLWWDGKALDLVNGE